MRKSNSSILVRVKVWRARATQNTSQPVGTVHPSVCWQKGITITKWTSGEWVVFSSRFCPCSHFSQVRMNSIRYTKSMTYLAHHRNTFWKDSKGIKILILNSTFHIDVEQESDIWSLMCQMNVSIWSWKCWSMILNSESRLQKPYGMNISVISRKSIR